MKKEKIIIIGATSAIAEHCARLWVKGRSVNLTLVGRDATRTSAIAADLRIRSPESTVDAYTADFTSPTAISVLVATLLQEGPVDQVLIAHGNLPDQQVCQNDLEQCAETLTINAVSPVLFAEAFANGMAASNQGTLGIIGSVAGDRGRKSNYVYGAAKGLVARYAQGLQHRFAQTPVKVVLIKPGPTDTPMTAHLKAQGAKLASAAAVAEAIVSGMKAGSRVVYAPKKWRIIMLIIMHLPFFIFGRMDI